MRSRNPAWLQGSFQAANPHVVCPDGTLLPEYGEPILLLTSHLRAMN